MFERVHTHPESVTVKGRPDASAAKFRLSSDSSATSLVLVTTPERYKVVARAGYFDNEHKATEEEGQAWCLIGECTDGMDPANPKITRLMGVARLDEDSQCYEARLDATLQDFETMSALWVEIRWPAA